MVDSPSSSKLEAAMAEQRHKEWQELMGAALDMLEHPERVEPAPAGKVQPAIRLWRYESFGPWLSWLLFTPSVNRGPKDLPVLRTIKWSPQDDVSRLTLPMEGLRRGFHSKPSFSIKDRTLPEDAVAEMSKQLRHIKLAVFAKGPSGCDGTSFGVETLDPFCSARVSWWEDGPPELASVRTWYDAAISLFTLGAET